MEIIAKSNTFGLFLKAVLEVPEELIDKTNPEPRILSIRKKQT